MGGQLDARAMDLGPGTVRTGAEVGRDAVSGAGGLKTLLEDGAMLSDAKPFAIDKQSNLC